MPVNIEQMTTEVVADSGQQLAGAAATPPAERSEDLAKLRFMLATAARLSERTRAEGCDD